MEWTQFWAVGVIALLLGGLAGSMVFSTETEVEKIVTVKSDCPACEVCEVCPEVEETETIVANELLNKAVEDFMEAVDDGEDEADKDLEWVSEVDGHEYDFDEISISKIYDDYSVSYDDDEYAVTFRIKLKYKEEDKDSEKVKYDVTVFYEPDEDTEVEVILA